ncbi:hypothetical protein, partial [Klebsiella pneumoniae]|uniref:hypothetical protein n=1 Tax=Klebsiella pneumoniae TaxID=573 RepID=UPI001BADE7D7
WCNRRASTPPLQLNAFPYWEGILANDKPVSLLCSPFCRVAAFALPGLQKLQYQTVMQLAVGPRKRSAAGQALKIALCLQSDCLPLLGRHFCYCPR